AGCAAALSLPQGARALLVERARPGSERCCGGLLTTDAVAALRALGLELPLSVCASPTPRLVHVSDLDSGREQSYCRDYVNLDRGCFDRWLLDLAAKRAEIDRGSRFIGRGPGPGEIRLKRGSRTDVIRAGLLIGADGANSTVRRACFPEHPGPPLMCAFQASLACAESPSDHEVLFASTLTDFYAWAIPKGDTVLVGCAFGDRLAARHRFETIIAWYREKLQLGESVLARAGRPLSRPRARQDLFAGDGDVLLVGEAAGLVSPASGEGISFALLSGAAAGRAAAADAPDRSYSKPFDHLARQVMTKTLKARVIYSPRRRALALRLPWCP
ncbi:MAG: hypothetical protein A2V88_04945, partial [Elusimicrobia bacterium RBG_16_66_12]